MYLSVPTNTAGNLTHVKEMERADSGVQCVNSVYRGVRLLHFNETCDGAKWVALFCEISGGELV